MGTEMCSICQEFCANPDCAGMCSVCFKKSSVQPTNTSQTSTLKQVLADFKEDKQAIKEKMAELKKEKLQASPKMAEEVKIDIPAPEVKKEINLKKCYSCKRKTNPGINNYVCKCG